MAELNFIRKDHTFIPAFESDREKFSKLKPGDLYRVKVTKQRIGRFLAKYWCLCETVIENLPDVFSFETPDGHYLPIKTDKDIERDYYQRCTKN